MIEKMIESQHTHMDFDPKDQPTPEDIESEEFQAVWGVIKGWDIQRSANAGYAGANGSDVMRILNALKRIER